jgi:hypothetical protein
MALGYVDFEFDLPEALLSRLVQVLDETEAAPLSKEFLEKVPEEQGVYQLFCDNELRWSQKIGQLFKVYSTD